MDQKGKRLALLAVGTLLAAAACGEGTVPEAMAPAFHHGGDVHEVAVCKTGPAGAYADFSVSMEGGSAADLKQSDFRVTTSGTDLSQRVCVLVWRGTADATLTITETPGPGTRLDQVFVDNVLQSPLSPTVSVSVGAANGAFIIFKNVEAPIVPSSGKIGDFVWSDTNGNGIQDAGEPGIAGQMVTLSQGGSIVASVITDASGNYLFSGLAAGCYTVTVGTPTGMMPSPSEVGDPALDSNGSPAEVCLATDASVDLTIDFGFVAVAPAIAIVKKTNGTDNNSPTGPVVPVGSTVTWTYEVTNTGNVPLFNVTVTDDQGVAVSCPKTTLIVGESMTCTGSGIATAGQYRNLGIATGSYNGTTVRAEDPDHYFGETPAGATLLIIDEDGIDNGLHLNRTGGGITPSGPSFWTDREVNDDIAAYGFRGILRYFADSRNFGRTITVRTGQTGDEGWFAPTCIPRKWLGSSTSSTANTCLEGAERVTGINNYFFSGQTPFAGAPTSWAIPQNRLDKIPHVMPLRARGLVSLIGKDVCAVVYDSDISINYDHGTSLGVNGNLQGATLGIAAFRVNEVRTLNNFSSSTLPEVQITVLDAAETCKNFQLFNAPVPNSSSEPNDRLVENLSGLGPKLYRSFKVWSSLEVFF
jgi:hypothetical protein